MRSYHTSFIIAGLCSLIFLAQQIWYWEVFNNLALISSDVWLKPWTLITHTFVHSDIMHLGYNMLALLLFGSILENIIGSKKFITVYLISGLAAGFVGVFLYTAAVGASGAVFGIMGCLALLRPKLTVWAMGAPMPMILAAGVWILVDFIGIMAPDNIAHEAHLFGIGVGIMAGLLLHDRFRESPRKEKPSEKPTDKEIDEWEEEYMKR